MLLTILLIVLLISLIGGGVGYRRYGAGSLGPVGLLLVIGIILYLTGNLNL